MNRWKRALGVAGVCAIAAGGVRAQEDPQPAMETTETEPAVADAQASEELGTFALTGEFLYLMPSLDDTYFVLKSSVSSTSPRGERQNNDLDYNPGFRLGVVYEFPESKRQLTLDYLFLDVNQNRTVQGDFLFATVGTPDLTSAFESYSGSAKSDVDLSYQRVNAAFIQPWRLDPIDFSFRFGLEYAYLQLGQEIRYDDNSILGVVNERARTWGIGPEVGVGLDYHILPDAIPGDLSLSLATSLAALIAQSDSHANNAISGAPTLLNVDDQDESRLVPGLHARVGLRYGGQLTEAFGGALSLGYQLDSYFDGLTRVSYPDDVGDALAETERTDFDAQGLYFAATLTF